MGVTEQQSSLTTDALSKDDWDLLGFTTRAHSPVVMRGCLVPGLILLYTRYRCTIVCVYNSQRLN